MKTKNTPLKLAGPASCLFGFANVFAPVNHGLAQTPDWSTSIAAIICDHCSHCHDEGAITPFSLMKYDEPVACGPSQLTQISNGIMPPYQPDPDYIHHLSENVRMQAIFL